MRKALFLLLFLIGGVAFVLTVGNKAASASTLPLIGQEQSGSNHNSTGQDATSDALTKQKNVNAPISILSWGSNNGDVRQGNQADTKSYADNTNGTDQKVGQDQSADVDGSRGTSPDKRDGQKHDGSGIAQDQSATNDNSTDQSADSSAETRQLNVNVPVSVLSWGSSNGDVRQGNQADTKSYADNTNGTDQKVDQEQDARVEGSGPDSHGYDPKSGHDCGCDGKSPKSERGHATIDQSQSASNDNSTDQYADSSATTEQKNFNAPFAFLSWNDSGCGCEHKDGAAVDQANHAKTASYAQNANDTKQSVDQSQDAVVKGHEVDPPEPGHDCGCNDHDGYFPKPPKDCGCEGHRGDDKAHSGPPIVQRQEGTNGNDTSQSADADATTKQKNVNAPFSLFTGSGSNDGCGCASHAPEPPKDRCGCESHGPEEKPEHSVPSHGGVTQHNDAKTEAGSSNDNQTRQSLDQLQEALIGRR
jgi:hypothetical protein